MVCVTVVGLQIAQPLLPLFDMSLTSAHPVFTIAFTFADPSLPFFPFGFGLAHLLLLIINLAFIVAELKKANFV